MQSLFKGELAVGNHIEKFENETANLYKSKFAVATNSGTSALHLIAIASSICHEDLVIIPTLTFAGSAFPFKYVDAKIIFIDSNRHNLLANLDNLESLLKKIRAKTNKRIHFVAVDLYGFMNDYESLGEICKKFNVNLIIDSAEAVGSVHKKIRLTNIAEMVALSFNGNKIITTSSGGMVLTDSSKLYKRIKFLRNQSKLNRKWYEHPEVGFNYRLSNISASIGRAQLSKIKKILKLKSEIHLTYRNFLASNNLVRIFDELDWSKSNFWLNVISFNKIGLAHEVHKKLLSNGVEARLLWKPLHLQPVFLNNRYFGNKNAQFLFENSLCLPSGVGISKNEIRKICEIINQVK